MPILIQFLPLINIQLKLGGSSGSQALRASRKILTLLQNLFL